MAIARFVVTCPKKAVSMLDFSLFRRPVFRLLVCFFMLAPVINCNLDYLPAIAAEKGLTETQASLLLSIIGALDLMCRLASGFIADSGKLRPATLIIITYVTMGVVNQFVRFLTTFPTFVVLAILQGLLGGVGNCLAVVLIIDIVGLENMSKAIGFAQLASGASLAAIYPLLGYIRDSTGSYVMVYHVVGLGILLAAGLLALQGLVKRWEKVPEKEDRRDVDVVVSELTEDR
nr:hypothetical protein BaRGS_027658 [Batillaria attramentaria]